MRRLALATLLAAPTAAAHGGFIDLRPQATFGVNVALPEARAFGGVELRAAGSVFGMGIGLALGYERDGLHDDRQGGYLLSQFEVRPLTWTDNGRPFSDVDLRLGLGALLGGVTENTFRAGVVISLGADVEVVPLDDLAPTLSVELRVVSPGTPDDATQFFLMLGVGARIAD